MMRGLTGSKPATSNFSSGGSGSTGRNLFARKGNSPLTRTGRGTSQRGPSGLSQSIRAESIDNESPPKKSAGTFRLAFDEFDDSEDEDTDHDPDGEEEDGEEDGDGEEEEDYDEEEEGEEEEEEEEEEYEEEDVRLPFGRSGHGALDAEVERYINREIRGEDESEEEASEDGEEEAEAEDDDDPFLTMHDEPHDTIEGSDMEDDLMVLTTPAADERARREAENIFRASSMRKSALGPKVNLQFDATSREHYRTTGPAIINETPDLILDTEDIVSRLYDEGIGAKDDAEKLDNSLGVAAIGLTQIWNDYAHDLPHSEQEHAAEIGPPPSADPFKRPHSSPICDWTLFRVKARASLDQLQRFAEGKDHQQFGSNELEQGNSLVGLARKAESQVPWEVYEQLTSIYDIVIGDATAILETAQDWCEATVGLCGWWDEEKDKPKKRRLGQSLNLLGSTQLIALEDYFERMARAVHTAVESDFHFDPRNGVAVAVASAFECNFAAVIGILRTWSLPIACATAEVAALGQWLPKAQPKPLLPMDTLDDDDLEVLGVPQQGPDEVEGIKDTTIVQYARELAGIDRISSEREGWEVAIQVLGRMDSVEKSEETVGELLHDLLETLQPDSSVTVDKMWRILSDLGMVSFAEETAEAFADLLGKDSHRYVYGVPPPSDLDDHLHRLLTARSATLEDLANLDIEAAELVGRILSGYATLRKFYEIRDSEDTNGLANPGPRSVANKKLAAAALVAAIASSDDNIRGVFGHQPPVLSLEQMDVLLKAIEDLETVGSRVYTACDEFFGLVLASAQGLKGSTPADLMNGSSMLASQLHRSISGSSLARVPKRGWDWRAGLRANSTAEEVLRILRLGLSKELARLWLQDADNVALF
ncbi:unnamed protein product [Parascedosporium putredinis]|uniref:Nuclear pore complex protein Nup85 n=1 Tax=Parascedosporium putredinis TaxID=1442378 RepID=A0A9P1H3F4_9PEZI|nr:unnamed protein product [Parascedosporium putredinis]CAI7995745.1 unnamed protein product [Parascedosporium putredinis]